MINEKCKVCKKKREQWKIFLLRETRSKKAIQYLYSVITENRKQNSFYFPVAGSDSKLHWLSAREAYTKWICEFMDFMLLCFPMAGNFKISHYIAERVWHVCCSMCVHQLCQLDEKLCRTVWRLFTQYFRLDGTAGEYLVQLPCSKQGRPEQAD